MLSPDLKLRVLEAARKEPAPVRRSVVLRTAILVVTAAAANLAVFFAIGGVRAAPRPMLLIVTTVAGSAGMAFVALVIAFGRGGSMLGRHRAPLIAAALATPVALMVWKLVWSAQFYGMTAEWPGRIGLRCLSHSLQMAAVPLVALALARRGSNPMHPVVTGAALGVATGAASWVFVDLWCPVAFPDHLLLGHVLPIAILAVVGGVLGRTLIAIRNR